MKYLYASCCVAVTIGVLALCWYACTFLRVTTATVQTNSAQVTKILSEVHNATQTATQAAQGLKDSADASKKYQDYILQHADNITHATEEGLVHFTRYTLPAIDKLVETTSTSIAGVSGNAASLSGAAQSDLNRVGTLLDGLSGTNAVLQSRIADPKIDVLEERFNVLALHLDGIATNSEAMSADMKMAVHRLAQPPSKFHTFLDASYTTLKFGSLFIP
jgi:uncharacterized phage infection (PIP) family protein YhgE